jgi:beta-galactosidase
VPNLIREVTFLMANRKSFNFYVAHGGTNFGFTAGANSGGKGGYEPDVTSYDYDAPIDEQGNATPKIPCVARTDCEVPAGRENIAAGTGADCCHAEFRRFAMAAQASLWDHLPKRDRGCSSATVRVHTARIQGLMLYRTTLVGRKSGRLRSPTFMTLL